ncbi:hypothetical protein G6F68_018255 [Rhizopus microsporus]|nr:hypothetical protein G6F68_018255 [Rhizopus microsporus]
MYMYQRGLTDVVPVSLNKRLSALQASEDKEYNTEKDILEFRAVVKGDVSGTVEAVVDSLAGLQNKQIRLQPVKDK